MANYYLINILIIKQETNNDKFQLSNGALTLYGIYDYGGHYNPF